MRQPSGTRRWVVKVVFLGFCVVYCWIFGLVGGVSSFVITQIVLDQKLQGYASRLQDVIRSLALCAGLLFGALFGLLLFLAQWFHSRLKDLGLSSRNRVARLEEAEPGTPADRPRDDGMTDVTAPSE
jgi:hypothetical protein